MSHRRGPLARLVTLLALLGCLLTPLVAFSQDTLAEIKKRGSINVFVEAQYRPYEFRELPFRSDDEKDRLRRGLRRGIALP